MVPRKNEIVEPDISIVLKDRLQLNQNGGSEYLSRFVRSLQERLLGVIPTLLEKAKNVE